MGQEGIEARLASFDPAAVARVARAALHMEDAAPVTLGEWRWEPLRSSLGIATGGLYRVQGTVASAGSAGPAHAWSAVLKVVRPPRGTRHDAAARDPQGWAYWLREPLAYGSGLLASLAERAPGGIVAPRCLWAEGLDAAAAAEAAEKSAATDGTGAGPEVWLWLEEVADRHDGWWPAERTLRAARQLGAFSGAFLGRPPDLPWLGRGYLQQRIERGPERLPLFEDESTWRHERLRPHFDPSWGARLRAIWERRWALLDVLDGLPETLCHGDCHRGNLLAVGERTVAIDWGTMGIGPVGADLAELALSRAIAGELLAPGGETFAERLLAEHEAGLGDAGAAGAAEAARVGFAVTAALAGTSRLHWTLERALDDARRAKMEESLWRETDDVLRRWGALTRMFLTLALEVGA